MDERCLLRLWQEAIRGKSFIVDGEEGDDDSEPRLRGKSNYSRRAEISRDRNQ